MKYLKESSIAIFITLTIIFNINAQRPYSMGQMSGTIKGVVIDSATKKSMEYATIAVFSMKEKKVVTGTVTNSRGFFNLVDIKGGAYKVEISYIGYEKKTINKVFIKPGNLEVNLGKIFLHPSHISLSEVTISGERLLIEYQIDKKVVDVSRDYSSAAGTVVDILENVPSINVDIEGNVSLRGSSGFTVLIDDKPTILDANEALQQIPASSVDKIEIITNPSAKYDPDGTAGIINIITKKGKLEGFNGLATLNLGQYGRYGGDILLNYRTKSVNYYISANFNKRTHPGSSEYDRELYGDTVTFISSIGERERNYKSHSIKGGIDWQIGSNDDLNLGITYGGRNMSGGSDLNYREYTVPETFTNEYKSNESYERGGDFWSINLDFRHKFEKKDHLINTQLFYSKRDWNETTSNELLDINNIVASGQLASESGPNDQYRLKLEYQLPINKYLTLEAGYQSRLNHYYDYNKMHEYDIFTTKYILLEEFSYNTEYKRNIHSLFSLLKGEIKNFGYQAGLRGEYTDRLIQLSDSNKSFIIDRWDYFPTLHFSYKFSKSLQFMASYTKRIERPRGWHLEPFITWSDAFNVRRGNPDLKPENIDSYEAGIQKRINKNFISLEAYYRITHNKEERIISVYDSNIMLHTYDNVGTDYALGTELMLTLSSFKWWDVNLMGNVFDYRIEGELFNKPFERHSVNWSVRFNNNFKITKFLRLQLNTRYVSPSVSAQGRREGFYTSDAAIRSDFFDRKLAVTFQVRDIFKTGRHEATSKGIDFHSYYLYTPKSPILSLTINYRINNYKFERKRMDNMNDFNSGDEF